MDDDTIKVGNRQSKKRKIEETICFIIFEDKDLEKILIEAANNREKNYELTLYPGYYHVTKLYEDITNVKIRALEFGGGCFIIWDKLKNSSREDNIM